MQLILNSVWVLGCSSVFCHPRSFTGLLFCGAGLVAPRSLRVCGTSCLSPCGACLLRAHPYTELFSKVLQRAPSLRFLLVRVSPTGCRACLRAPSPGHPLGHPPFPVLFPGGSGSPTGVRRAGWATLPGAACRPCSDPEHQGRPGCNRTPQLLGSCFHLILVWES